MQTILPPTKYLLEGVLASDNLDPYISQKRQLNCVDFRYCQSSNTDTRLQDCSGGAS